MKTQYTSTHTRPYKMTLASIPKTHLSSLHSTFWDNTFPRIYLWKSSKLMYVHSYAWLVWISTILLPSSAIENVTNPTFRSLRQFITSKHFSSIFNQSSTLVGSVEPLNNVAPNFFSHSISYGFSWSLGYALSGHPISYGVLINRSFSAPTWTLGLLNPLTDWPSVGSCIPSRFCLRRLLVCGGMTYYRYLTQMHDTKCLLIC